MSVMYVKHVWRGRVRLVWSTWNVMYVFVNVQWMVLGMCMNNEVTVLMTVRSCDTNYAVFLHSVFLLDFCNLLLFLLDCFVMIWMYLKIKILDTQHHAYCYLSITTLSVGVSSHWRKVSWKYNLKMYEFIFC